MSQKHPKRPKTNNQLSLNLDPSSIQEEMERADEFKCTSATILTFPASNKKTSSFRQRVKQDLIRNHLMVD